MLEGKAVSETPLVNLMPSQNLPKQSRFISFDKRSFDQRFSDRLCREHPFIPKFMPKSDSPPAANLFLDNQLCFALYAVSLAMTKTYRPLLVPLGLTYPQYVVMLALWQQRELTAGALAQAVALDAGTLVPLVRKLVAQGLLARRRSDEDDRVVLISVTPAGQALKRRAHAVHEQVGCSTQSSASERKALTASLQALRSALSA